MRIVLTAFLSFPLVAAAQVPVAEPPVAPAPVAGTPAPPPPTPPPAAAPSSGPDVTATAPSTFRVGGSVDTYLSLNTRGEMDAADTNELRAFDVQHGDLALAYAELHLERAAAPVGFRLDLGFGPTAEIVNATDRDEEGFDVFRHVQQALVTYRATPTVTLRLGKMVTHHGLEVIEAQDNWLYTRGLLFTWAIPFTQTGLAVSWEPSPQIAVTGFWVNGLNNVIDRNEFKSPGLQVLARPADGVTLVANYSAFNELPGEQGELGDLGAAAHLVDLIATWAVAPRLELALNADVSVDGSLEDDNTFVGVAGLVRARPTATTEVAARGELVGDSASPTLGVPGDEPVDLASATVAGSWAPATGLLVRAEVRLDQALGGGEPFTGDGSAAGTSDRQVTWTLAAVAAF